MQGPERKNDTLVGDVEKLLHKLYYDAKSPSAYTSAQNVFQAARKRDPKIKWADVEIWFRKQLTATIHKPIRLNFPRNQVFVHNIDDQWQADLCDMSSKAEYNDGSTFILSVIDCFSKYGWTIPIKSKHGVEIVRALNSIFTGSDRKPKRLQTDKGTEFLNKKVQAFLNHHDVQLFTTQSEKKASIVERFNRTMKGRTYKYFTANNTYRYIDILQSLVDGYNNTRHRTIGMRPADVRAQHTFQIRRRMYGGLSQRKRGAKKLGTRAKSYKQPFKFMIGDHVRISKNRLTFSKGYLPNWPEEIFMIFDRDNKFTKTVYHLRDFEGEAIKGAFYVKELQLVSEPDEYRIEKVLRKKRVNGKLLQFVKWKGWPSKFNSWVESARNI